MKSQKQILWVLVHSILIAPAFSMADTPDLTMTQAEVLKNKICVVQKDLEKPQNPTNQNNCIDKSHFLVEPSIKSTSTPEKILEKVQYGPKLDEVGYGVFTKDTEVFCRYFYQPQNGSSKKFRCYRTDENNQLMNEDGEIVVEAKSVVSAQINNKLDEDVLVDKHGKVITKTETTKTGEVKTKLQKADVLKVRYTDYDRNRENFGGTFAARLSWLLGVPTEHSYMTRKVTCFGCRKDPWQNNGLDVQKQNLPGEVNSFDFASIERKNEAKRIIKAKGTQIVPWKWADVLDRYKNGVYNEDTKNELLVMAQFAALLQTVEHSGQQHVMLCEKSDLGNVTLLKNNNSPGENFKYCAKPIAAMHDIGGALGNRIMIDPATKNHPRSDYSGYVAAKMFNNDSNPKDCTLLNTLRDKYSAGFPVITQRASEDFKKMISVITPELVRELFIQTHFEMADQKLRSKISDSEQVKSEKAIQAWTQAFMQKVEIFRNRECK